MSDDRRRDGAGRHAGAKRKAGGESAGQESAEGEPEPPEAGGGSAGAGPCRDEGSAPDVNGEGAPEAGDPLGVSWSQPQGDYPAPERPLDTAEARAASVRRRFGAPEACGEAAADAGSAAPPARRKKTA